MGVAKTFRELKIWGAGIELVKSVYRVSNAFPKTELYGLTAQMRRAAVSIPANIAEGFRRKGGKEFKQFLNVSHGSLAELETHLVVACELGYIRSVEVQESVFNQIDDLSRMIAVFIKRIESRLAMPAHSIKHSAQFPKHSAQMQGGV